MVSKKKLISKVNFYKLIMLVALVTILTNFKLHSVMNEAEKIFNKIKNKHEMMDKLFDKECDKLGEWESLGRSFYFKRNALFYFQDAAFFRLNFIADQNVDESRFLIDVKIEFENQSVHTNIIQYKIEPEYIENTNQWMVQDYFLMQLDAKFNLSAILLMKNLTQVSQNKVLILRIKISELYSNTNSHSYLRVKVKNLLNPHNQKQKTAMICAKCFILNNTSYTIKLLNWWLELNKMIGYDRIEMCNHSIQFSENLVFKKNFLAIKNLKCIPNLQGINGKKYLDSNFGLKDATNGEHNVYKYDIINQLVLNECYLNNFDKYKYISVFDIDETVLPKTTQLFLSGSKYGVY
jgi:hypothetical protein